MLMCISLLFITLLSFMLIFPKNFIIIFETEKSTLSNITSDILFCLTFSYFNYLTISCT